MLWISIDRKRALTGSFINTLPPRRWKGYYLNINKDTSARSEPGLGPADTQTAPAPAQGRAHGHTRQAAPGFAGSGSVNHSKCELLYKLPWGIPKENTFWGSFPLSCCTTEGTDTNVNSPVPLGGITGCWNAGHKELQRKRTRSAHPETFNIATASFTWVHRTGFISLFIFSLT